MKPIIRWTIGNVSNLGIKCLSESVRGLFNIYGDKFEYYICYNQINLKKISSLEKYKVNFLNQHEHLKSLKIKPTKKHPCWKLYPPRINKETHEIFIDNDLIIYKKIPLIESFLQQKDLFIISEAFQRSYGLYSDVVKRRFVVNTGFFGVPPNYDFANDLNNNLPKGWTPSSNNVEKDLVKKGHFDEQGLVAFIFQNKKTNIISSDQISIYMNKTKGTCGTHYIGINKIHTYMKFI